MLSDFFSFIYWSDDYVTAADKTSSSDANICLLLRTRHAPNALKRYCRRNIRIFWWRVLGWFGVGVCNWGTSRLCAESAEHIHFDLWLLDIMVGDFNLRWMGTWCWGANKMWIGMNLRTRDNLLVNEVFYFFLLWLASWRFWRLGHSCRLWGYFCSVKRRESWVKVVVKVTWWH